jgi:hypothetical protein
MLEGGVSAGGRKTISSIGNSYILHGFSPNLHRSCVINCPGAHCRELWFDIFWNMKWTFFSVRDFSYISQSVNGLCSNCPRYFVGEYIWRLMIMFDLIMTLFPYIWNITWTVTSVRNISYISQRDFDRTFKEALFLIVLAHFFALKWFDIIWPKYGPFFLEYEMNIFFCARLLLHFTISQWIVFKL